MGYDEILQAITTVGFPIVMCGILMWFIYKLIQNHKEETEQFTDALNKNTLVLQKVCDKLGQESEVE